MLRLEGTTATYVEWHGVYPRVITYRLLHSPKSLLKSLTEVAKQLRQFRNVFLKESPNVLIFHFGISLTDLHIKSSWNVEISKKNHNGAFNVTKRSCILDVKISFVTQLPTFVGKCYLLADWVVNSKVCTISHKINVLSLLQFQLSEGAYDWCYLQLRTNINNSIDDIFVAIHST